MEREKSNKVLRKVLLHHRAITPEKEGGVLSEFKMINFTFEDRNSIIRAGLLISAQDEGTRFRH